ncbi:MAG: hypothetical protein AB8B93_00050 [Pseudomonadales bacterium]
MAEQLKDSPVLKIIAIVLGSLILLGQFASCQQRAELNNYYSDQLQQNQMMQQNMYQDLQNQNQMQQQQSQQMLNEMNQMNGGGYYAPRSSEPQE